MKPQPHDEADRQVSRLLQEWRVTGPLPPRFQEHVWHRIETAARPEKSAGWNWLALLFARPALATACATLLLLAGPVTGLLTANHEVARVNTELAHRYVASVDPYAHQGF